MEHGGGFHPEHHEEMRPIAVERPIVVETPVYRCEEPIVVDRPLVVETPVAVEPILFAEVRREELGKLFEKLEGQGYHVHPASEISGTVEHGGIFDRFTVPYTFTSAGLQVSACGHEGKVREDIEKALMFARS